jgi:hypothetical protein
MEHYICRTVTELPGYMFALIKVPEGDSMAAGEVYKAETLDTTISGNTTVYVAEYVTDKNDLPVIALNDSFETLLDGRRPDGQPDYTQYVYNEGEVINSVRLDKNVKLELGTDTLSNQLDMKDIDDTNLKDTWLYINNEGRLTWSNSFANVSSRVYFVIEAVKYFRLGGQSGMEFARTLVVRVKHQNVKSNPGDPDITKINANLTPNLKIGEENVASGAVIATLSVEGGTAPVTYAFKTNPTVGADNDKFVIDGDNIKVGANALTEAKTYMLYVEATDTKGKVFDEGFDIPVSE